MTAVCINGDVHPKNVDTSGCVRGYVHLFSETSSILLFNCLILWNKENHNKNISSVSGVTINDRNVTDVIFCVCYTLPNREI